MIYLQFPWRNNSDSYKSKPMSLVAKEKKNFLSKLRLSIVKAYQQHHTKKMLSHDKSMKKARKVRRSKGGYPSILYDDMPKFNAKHKSDKKSELLQVQRTPRPKYSNYHSNCNRSHLWKLSQVPEINISKYTSFNDGPTTLFKFDSPSVSTSVI